MKSNTKKRLIAYVLAYGIYTLNKNTKRRRQKGE